VPLNTPVRPRVVFLRIAPRREASFCGKHKDACELRRGAKDLWRGSGTKLLASRM